MSGRIDEFKGRAKEAAGDLADDDQMKKEGQKDQMAGKVKQAAETVKDKFEDGVDKVKDKLDKN